ncbi:MAG: alpha/beta fold hydrolase [bacterium]
MLPWRRNRPKLHFAKTRDGWSLALHRYQPEQKSPWGPVVLCHGLTANRFDLDAPDAKISLARYLFEHGHDVWVVELRGSGKSRPPGWPLRRRVGFDFDDYVHRDVPAIIRYVLDHADTLWLHWVGHSMGGMLAYAALEHYDQRLFRSVVTIGSPAFTAVKHPLVDRLYKLRFLLKVLPWLPSRFFAQLGSLAPQLVGSTLGSIVANPDNMDPKHIRSLLRNAIEDLPASLLEQFAEWYGGPPGFKRHDGLLDYYAQMKRIDVPMLVIAGACDILTPVADLRSVYESIGSKDKSLLIVGREQGFSADYGHIDLILGTAARREVYPHIADWIEAHK